MLFLYCFMLLLCCFYAVLYAENDGFAGEIIEVVQVLRNSNGLTVLQTITAPAGATTGGWVKLKTSKGKILTSNLTRSNRSN